MHAAIFSAYLDGGFLLAATARIYCSAGSGVFMLLDIAMPALAGGATLSMVANAATQAEWDAVRRTQSSNWNSGSSECPPNPYICRDMMFKVVTETLWE